MNANLTLELSVRVTYQTNGEHEDELRGVLCRAAEHLADNGLLSADSKAEVVECTHEIKGLWAASPSPV